MSPASNGGIVPDAIERRARELAGGIHARGAIPSRFWKEAIAEHLGERALDPEWAEATVERWESPRLSDEKGREPIRRAR